MSSRRGGQRSVTSSVARVRLPPGAIIITVSHESVVPPPPPWWPGEGPDQRERPSPFSSGQMPQSTETELLRQSTRRKKGHGMGKCNLAHAQLMLLAGFAAARPTNARKTQPRPTQLHADATDDCFEPHVPVPPCLCRWSYSPPSLLIAKPQRPRHNTRVRVCVSANRAQCKRAAAARQKHCHTPRSPHKPPRPRGLAA